MKPSSVVLSKAAQFKALGHPLRQKILQALDQGPANLKELGERTGSNPATILHHVRLLVDAEFVRIKDEVKIGSIASKRYELVSRVFMTDPHAVAFQDADVAVTLGDQLLTEAQTSYHEAIAKDLATIVTTENPLWLDEARWDQFQEELQALFNRYKSVPTGQNLPRHFTATILLVEHGKEMEGDNQ
ncbi:MAG: winged helix-turn-helix domain-containing protein [Firmicutes bacterium]|jgi:DNA-binding transcriptional ArsR family regulator|nr:winged helix-turn-helix domain-containing protein [Bacillota bacterium]